MAHPNHRSRLPEELMRLRMRFRLLWVEIVTLDGLGPQLLHVLHLVEDRLPVF